MKTKKLTKEQKHLTKLNDETFCVKKNQFKLVLNDCGLVIFFNSKDFKNSKSHLILDTDEWELFEETKDVYWFKRNKNG